MSIIEKSEIIFEVLGKVDNIYRAQYREAAALLDDLIKEIEQRKAITEAAKFLVKVKRHKDTHGKGAWYLASKPIAWKKLNEALDNLGEDNE